MNASGLLPYQIPSAEALLSVLRSNGGALDGSDMGTGKTFVAGAIIRELSLPTLVAVPAVSLSSWRRMGEALGVAFDVQSLDLLRGGNTLFGRWENPPPKVRPLFFRCEVCQCEVDPARPFPCVHGPAGIHCVKTLKREHKYGKFVWHPGIRLLVVDEVHRCGSMDSLQGDMLVAAKRAGILVLGLSATVGDSPLAFRALGYCLGLHGLVDSVKSRGFYSWAQKYGCRRLPMMGFQWPLGEGRKRAEMLKLHAELYPSRGHRVRISDLGNQFPECQIVAELVDLDSGGRLKDLYAQMEEQLRLMNERRDRDAQGPLSEFLRIRQQIGLLKVPVLAEFTRDWLDAGKHVALFVNYRAEVESLCKLLKTDCRVDGSQTGDRGRAQRDRNVDRFQSDEEPVIVCSSAAGGIAIGLHDLHGNFPRAGGILPGYSAREFRQVCGRLPRQGGKSKSFYRAIFAAGTPEEKGYRALTSKLNNLDALNDGDLFPFENLPLVASANGHLTGSGSVIDLV